MNKQEKQLKIELENWMKQHLSYAESNGLYDLINCFNRGEVNTTLLAEDAAYDSNLIDNPDEALDYSEHIIWDAVIDAAEWYENQRS